MAQDARRRLVVEWADGRVRLDAPDLTPPEAHALAPLLVTAAQQASGTTTPLGPAEPRPRIVQ